MDEAILGYAPPDEVVRLAKEAGMTTGQIVRIVSGCLPYRGALQVARANPQIKITTKLLHGCNSQRFFNHG